MKKLDRFLESNNSIYYLTTELREIVERDFVFVENISWFKIYKDPLTGEHWRIDISDKYQTEYMVKIPKDSNWEDFDSKELEIDLLKQNRGETEALCIWQKCDRKALNETVYCAYHAYNEMNIRK